MFDTTLFLLQLAVIIGVSRIVAWIFQRLGQSQVVGEMAAGIALGPTLLGQVAPDAFHALFPPASMGFLNALSQVGLVVFVYLVGVRTDFTELRLHSKLAAVASAASIGVPMGLGAVLALYLYRTYGTGNELAFTLFIATAISVTAFPVLARILMERNLLHTRVGALAIACAGVSDLVAWLLLTLITVLRHGNWSPAPLAVQAAAYGIGMWLVWYLMRRVASRWDAASLPMGAIAVLIVVALLSAAATDWMGLHSLVGALLAGLITPRKLRVELVSRLESATILLMIPIFFAMTGIKTNLVFPVVAGRAYLDLLVILTVAVVSKFGAGTLASRWMGLSWNEASQLGVMLNTRGLVELIVLNVGLETGIITEMLFSQMVCMAVVTTVMATPLLDALRRRSVNGLEAASTTPPTRSAATTD